MYYDFAPRTPIVRIDGGTISDDGPGPDGDQEPQPIEVEEPELDEEPGQLVHWVDDESILEDADPVLSLG